MCYNLLMQRKPQRFVGLHSHSGASAFDGLGPPQQHIDFVRSNGMDAWALTDHGHMNSFAGAFLHTEKLNSSGANFKFIPGVEAYIHPDLKQWKLEKLKAEELAKDAKAAKLAAKKAAEGIKTNIERVGDGADETVEIEVGNALTIENEDETRSSKTFNPINRRHHLVILPKTPRALQKIFHLVSRGYLEGFYKFPRIDLGMLREAAGDEKDIIVSSACLGGIFSYDVLNELRSVDFNKIEAGLLDNKALLERIMVSLGNTYDMYADAVGRDNMYLELQFNRLSAQDTVNRALIEFARRNSITDKLIVTSDSHYAGPDLWYHREMYKKLGYLNYTQYGPDTLPKSKEDIKADLYPKNASQVWDEYLQAREKQPFYEGCDEVVCNAIERTHDLAHQEIGSITYDKSYKFPTKVVPQGKTAFEVLLQLSKEGLVNRGLADKPEYIERMKYELGVIKKMNFAEYFVTLARMLKLAREVCLLGVARGSGGGSLVAYCLDITDLDPIKYECRFDRFLNEHRCLHPETLVKTADGTAKISDLKMGDYVVGGSGENRLVKAVYKTKSTKLYKISAGGEEFICSPNHKWIVLRDGTRIEVSAKEILPTDHIFKYVPS